MIKTTGVYHIGIPVDDMRRAVTFYTEVLGMTLRRRGDFTRSVSGGFLETG